MKNYTDVTVILDRSGSMQTIKNDIIGGFNNFLSEQRKIGHEVRISLNQFNNSFEPVYSGKLVAEAPEFSDSNYSPNGGTALNDAIARTINATGARYAALDEKDRPERVVIVILTDGEENDSREFTGEAVKDLVTHQQDKYKWQFLFLGANQDAVLNAQKYAIRRMSGLTYAANSMGVQNALRSMSASVQNYASMATVDCLFVPDDTKAQEVLLQKTTP